MRFVYGKQDMRTLERAQENCFLLTNGLGGYASVMAGFAVPRCDQGLLVAAVKAPNVRINMVHRMQETLTVGQRSLMLSSQAFADGTEPEEGFKNLASFVYDGLPCWVYDALGVRVERKMVMEQGKNTTAVLYTIENRSGKDVALTLRPFLKFVPREDVLKERRPFVFQDGKVTADGYTLYIKTDGALSAVEPQWELLSYSEDAKDGRPDEGLTGCCCQIQKSVAADQVVSFQVVFSLEDEAVDAKALIEAHYARQEKLLADAGLQDPIARELVLAADAYIARRDSTDGKTILAGYPLFSDWGRDTMISLPGCCLSTGRYEDAKSILRTFMAYEKDGLVPNLFPEGETKPMYNTVDAALLLIDAVWQYHRRTGDDGFVREAWPVMVSIIENYKKGTHHSISMDTDGLIRAGGGLDQVTWMDVCVNGILPTPRHGKPVEINAYWYNALKIMAVFADLVEADALPFAQLAEQVKASFLEKFYMADKGYLKDVISGTKCDEQLRCNQIWAVSMPFTMLDPQQEKSVVDTVRRHLYTPCGLRTLSPEDPEYHPHYGGDMVTRDMAYHQGTTWVFPMGAYYMAYLKVYGEGAAAYVRSQLDAMEPMLREGCAGQLPEIYEGDFPTESKGCFGQAWSVGEILRVFEAIEKE
ncbi:MAG: glycogen debranching enzyme family protein [Oscillospiraceae bacterium]|nr:glycogen debranching enzyme family protein [Oscillospiraceae bacterium]